MTSLINRLMEIKWNVRFFLMWKWAQYIYRYKLRYQATKSMIISALFHLWGKRYTLVHTIRWNWITHVIKRTDNNTMTQNSLFFNGAEKKRSIKMEIKYIGIESGDSVRTLEKQKTSDNDAKTVLVYTTLDSFPLPLSLSVSLFNLQNDWYTSKFITVLPWNVKDVSLRFS